jgi:sterol desaturase/sphingolipid hydroxylase (fatty acid hydroxylase superfamily)
MLALPLGLWVWLWKYAGWDASIALMVIYWSYLLVLFWLEKLIPFENAWTRNDGQLGNDLILSVSSVAVNSIATVALLWLITAAIGVAESLTSLNVWPVDWPFIAQVVVGVLLWDLGNHLAHRWAHKVQFLWRFHSVHHSAPRLSVINTGRFHPFDVVKSVVIGAPVPVLLGVPADVSLCYAAFNVFTGLLTHSNLDVDCGIFNAFLSTPNLHRWHHSPQRQETDTNFGEATVVWDRIFGTYFNPSRRPRRNVGLGPDVRVSAKLFEALVQPFTPKGHDALDAHLIKQLQPGEAGVAGEEALVPKLEDPQLRPS